MVSLVVSTHLNQRPSSRKIHHAPKQRFHIKLGTLPPNLKPSKASSSHFQMQHQALGHHMVPGAASFVCDDPATAQGTLEGGPLRCSSCWKCRSFLVWRKAERPSRPQHPQELGGCHGHPESQPVEGAINRHPGRRVLVGLRDS